MEPERPNPTSSQETANLTKSATRERCSIWGYVLAAGMLALLLYLADWQELNAAFQQMTLEALLYLVLISALLIYISAFKWHFFLESFGAQIRISRLCRLYLIGYFVNLAVPSFVGGDAVRSWYAGKIAGQHQALASTILERYTGALAMVTLACVFVWFTPGVTTQITWLIIGVTAALAVMTMIALSSRAMQIVSRVPFARPISKHLLKIQQALQLASRDIPLLCKSLGLSFLFHSVTVINTVAAGAVVGWDNPPLGELFVVLPLILLVGALPLTPNGLGIQEGAFFYFLGMIGASPAQALGIAIILRAKSYLLAMIGWLLWITEGRPQENHPSC